jgi:hypothetical protein
MRLFQQLSRPSLNFFRFSFLARFAGDDDKRPDITKFGNLYFESLLTSTLSDFSVVVGVVVTLDLPPRLKNLIAFFVVCFATSSSVWPRHSARVCSTNGR